MALRGDTSVAYNVFRQFLSRLDERVKLVKELGGSLMFEVLDSPFGRIGRLMDPQGASFWVLQRA